MNSPSVKFLLVDDLQENLLSLEALLGRDDLDILKARSGDEALELLLQHDVALALLDVQMPGMDGFELAEFMRGNERTRHIPIIFVTAGTTDAQRRFRGYEAGAVDFIQKPIEADILRSKAEVFFDLHRQRQIVAAQRDALETATQALKEADRRKDVFIAILAHELRNPVAALHAGMHLLQKRADTDQAPFIRERMERQLAHLRRLVDDLLDVSRIAEGKISLKKERIDLATVLRSAIEASQANIDAAGHAFTTDIQEEPVSLVVDHTRVAQIIANLLNNAARYTPPGGAIHLRARSIDQEVEIEVRDNGVGIPQEMQARIFQIFAQVEGQQDKATGGLGIGLALVRQLVGLHQGTIEVASEGAGKGSSFTVRIPLSSTEIQAGEALPTG
ncbi:hybrid sensor histidine kinase/response regulator [Sphingomonas sp. R-74633]|uniref:hybrid sensor histidine kinase/response regulator n=1 Tax=Sphingomonas sp. R-74633 TaxID=2751188 RepID=UPI0015D0FD86|nr:hybrid sensor histidine kinase/response regulator [Sphingomonas sp. R-74633]NYT40732.1 hybrid sensor histidine kinase/response regulator [Sphingomonas sp. R-74633]